MPVVTKLAKAIGDGFNGGLLKFWHQRGIDAETASHQLLFGVIL